MNKPRKSFVLLVTIVVVLGFVAGVVGELWVNSFLLPDPYLNFKNYSDLSTTIEDLLVNEGKSVSLHERDVAIHNSIQSTRPSTVKIYRYRNFAAGSINSLLPGDLLGQGAIITNDGWILTSQQVVLNSVAKYWVVTNDHQVLLVEKVVHDKNSGAAFVKVDKNNLSVIDFTLRSDIVDGQSVYLFGFNSSVMTDNISNHHLSRLVSNNDYVHSSEKFHKYIFLGQSHDSNYSGSPVVNLDGKMVGLYLGSGSRVVPIDHLTEVMKKVIRGEKWQTPYLGIKFVDLNGVLNPTIERTSGALIISAGVRYDSPAKGLLFPNDIITQIEGEELNANKNLSDLLAQYSVGDVIKFTVLRDGEVEEVLVTLE